MAFTVGDGSSGQLPLGSGAVAGALAGGAMAVRRPKRAKRSVVKPAAQPLPGGSGGGTGFDVGSVAERLAQRQEELANAQQGAELDALINRLRAEEEADMADFNSELSAIPQRQQMLEGDARRGALTTGAIGRRGLAGRGLALSGIRAGFEGRTEADLLRRLGSIGQQSQDEEDAIRRAIERLKESTAAQVAEAQAKKQAFA